MILHLDADEIIGKARKEAGLYDFGDDSFIVPFKAVLDRVEREVTFKPNGLENFLSTIHRLLINRLRMQADISRRPEILQEDVSDPIIILGLPRTGTTKLQRMLSTAPDVQKLYLWRMLNIAPFPGATEGEFDPRIMALVPGAPGSESLSEHEAYQAAHHQGLTEVEEEVILKDLFLDVSIAGLCSYVPLLYHRDWLAGAQERESDIKAYSYLKKMLQYMQWQDGGKQDRPWIMKAPSHTPHLVALVEAFPNASFIQCHRDPCVVVPSAAKLMTQLWGINAHFDEKAVGREMYDWIRVGMLRFLAARKQLQFDNRILDVKYSDVRSNVMSVIEAIYRHSGRELSDEARAAMLQWDNDNEQGKHGKHVYSLSEFDLDEATVQQAFAQYTENFSAYF